MPFPLAAGIAIGQAAVSGVNSLLQVKNNKAGREWNEQMYNRQRADALADFHMQNDYNSPAAQMKRLEAAGLNPNLVYGDGATTPTAQIRSSSVESYKPQAPQIDYSTPSSSLFQMYDLEQKKAQTDNLKAQNDVLVQDAILKAAQTASTTAQTAQTGVQTQQSRLNLDTSTQLQQTSLETSKAQLAKLQADTTYTLDQNERAAAMQATNLQTAAENILNLRSQRANNEAQRAQIKQQITNLKTDNSLKEADLKLKKAGIQPGDPAYMRILQQVLDIDPAKAGQSIKKELESLNWSDLLNIWRPTPHIPTR